MLCAMANPNSLPLYEKTWRKPTLQRVMDSSILLLLLLLLTHRLFSFFFFDNFTLPLLAAFLCESCFAFAWAVIISTKWSPAEIKTFPQRLFDRVTEDELPPVDLFVTTADPVLEPPILTVNTVLSLLALDYPTQKLACYVSDDGCSSLTFYALVEATKFAKLWVPFCKKYQVPVRVPFRYFSNEDMASNSRADLQDWFKMKNEYEDLCRKIQDAESSPLCHLDKEFADFLYTDRRNHPTIIKVLWDNKECHSNGMPHLVYVSREKRPHHPHHYKAGALNALVRVSSVTTNAPYLLNVDCDMFVNNPKVVLHAMCILLDSKSNNEIAFVQCPQQFYGKIKDDPFGNQFRAISAYVIAGLAGLQGPFYFGTNCFHRRKVIYGLYPAQLQNQKEDLSLSGKFLDKDVVEIFGSSKELVKSAASALMGKTNTTNSIIPSDVIEKATQVAGCGYESDTAWGKQVGWLYGSVAEDNLTGLEIQRRGWKSEICMPDPIAFTGCAPMDLPLAVTQQKRWASGLLEILFSKHCPILGSLFGRLQFRQCSAYIWLMSWALLPIPELCYAVLTVHCIITNTGFLPQEFGRWILVALSVTYNIYTLYEYLAIGLSIREWWNNQRMARIGSMNAWFCGFLTTIFKLLGMSETVFEVTQKEPPTSNHDEANADAGRFTFTDSPVFVPGTTILLLQLTALAVYLLGLQPPAPPASAGGGGCGLGEIFCGIYLVVCYWPFLKGLFSKGKYGIPLPTVWKSALLAFGFVHLSRSAVTA